MEQNFGFWGCLMQIINSPLILPPSVDSTTASLLEGLLEKGGQNGAFTVCVLCTLEREVAVALCQPDKSNTGFELFMDSKALQT